MPRSKEQFEKIRNSTKQLILEAGLKVFSKKGFHGASISDIAKEAGVSKGLAYNYFASKKELAVAVLNQISVLLQEMEQLFLLEDPYEIIKLTISSVMDNLRKNEEFWRLYMGLITSPEMSEIAAEIFSKVMEGYLKKVEKLFKQIGLPNPKAEAYIFGALLDGIPMDYLIDKENYPLKTIEKHLLKKYSKEELQKLIN